MYHNKCAADTDEITLIIQKECNSTLKEICQSIRIKTSLPEGELDFTSLTLYFYNKAEGVYYQAQIEDVTKEADTTVSLLPGVYRLDNSFTQFDGFYNLNYTSELKAEEFKISGNDAESEEEWNREYEKGDIVFIALGYGICRFLFIRNN